MYILKMSNIEYDLDVSGGLMPQVQALIAPPVSEDESKNKRTDKSEHPYFKRPGKGHNHDNCDACSEGGDLICCDKCPASFHLTCHDPPLDETDIPTGQWLCHHCRKTKEPIPEKIPQLRSKRFCSNSSSDETVSNDNPKKTKLTPMDILIEAASILNPKQFELPRELTIPSIFPGTDKDIIPNVRSFGKNRAPVLPRNNKKTAQHEYNASGLIPLPTKTCYECRKSCRVGVLVSCDYCSLLFHLDCLDPPLTALPTGRWMCPNHAEQYIDQYLVKSVSATERISLWDKFTGPVDQDAIKLEFFRKIHSANPPFRFKMRMGRRKKAQIPLMVRQHYKNPVPLLPSVKDVLRLETTTNRTQDYFDYMTPSSFCSSDTVTSVEDSAKVNGQIESIVCNGAETSNVDIVFTDEQQLNGKNKNSEENLISIKNDPEIKNGQCNRPNSFKLPDIISGPVLHANIERCLNQLDDRLIRVLAYQRIQQLLSSSTDAPNLQNVSSLITNSLQGFHPHQKNRHMPLPSELLTPADIDRISRVFTSPKKPKTSFRSRSTIRARAILCPVVSKHFYNVRTSEVDPSQVRHDASFMGFRPTVSNRFPEASAMRYRSLSIGRGSANDVELERFGHCNFISPKHAVIFYDEYTKHYELINYSDYGTYVNNVLYSCDTSFIKSTKTPEKSNSISTKVKEIIDKKRNVVRPKESNISEARMTAVDNTYENMECNCGNLTPSVTECSDEMPQGWEGAALLGHGALLRFGCISFVFSIVECASV